LQGNPLYTFLSQEGSDSITADFYRERLEYEIYLQSVRGHAHALFLAHTP
jgi:hypothetical protein